MKFQEIPDSPTLKYYTNWKEFEKRIHSPPSKKYNKLPLWMEKIKEKNNSIIILTKKLNIEKKDDAIILETFKKESIKLETITYIDRIHISNITNAYNLNINQDTTMLIASNGGDGFTAHHLTINIKQGVNAEITIVDNGGLGNKSIKTSTILFKLGKGSKLKLIIISTHGETAVYTRRIYDLLEKSELEIRELVLGGPSTRIGNDVYLNGVDSKVRIYSSVLAKGSSWIDVLQNVIHQGPKTQSIVKARGASIDKAFLSIRGIAIVKDEAIKSRSHVDAHALILSPNARANASPMLEIHTGDVEEAFHSASVHSIDEQELFYMSTRGLSKDDVIKLIIEGVSSFSGVPDMTGISFEKLLF